MKYKLYQHISKWIKHITNEDMYFIKHKMMKYIPSCELYSYYCSTNDEQLVQSYMSFVRVMTKVVEIMVLHVSKRERIITKIDGNRSTLTEYYFIVDDNKKRYH
jgi:hypothetical protein